MVFTLILDKIVLKYNMERYCSIIKYKQLLDRGVQQSGHVVRQFEGGIVLALFEEYNGLTPDSSKLRKLLLRKIIPGAILFNSGSHTSLSL